MIDASQLRKDIVRPSLQSVGLWTQAAENLVLGTCAQESRLGTYVRQIGGPALGIFQMEPATHDDIWENFLRYRPDLRELIMLNYVPATTEPEANDLIGNLGYAAAMCRIHYLRVPQKLPAPHDVAGMARYWKQHYNTDKGRGTEAEFIRNFNAMVV